MEKAVRIALAGLLAAGLAACGGGGDGPPVRPVISDPVGGPPADPIDDDLEDENLPPSAAAQANPRQGPPPLAVTFDASASTDSDGAIVSYRWDFGDGGRGFGATVSHVYTRFGDFSARLIVTDDDGAIDSTTVLVSVRPADENLPPSPAFTADPREGAAPLRVSFDASASTDSDGAIVEYRWDFGDGASATGPRPSHGYDSPGDFVARLTIVDDDGAAASASLLISVLAVDEIEAGDAPRHAAGALTGGARQLLALEADAPATLTLSVPDHDATDPGRNRLRLALFDAFGNPLASGVGDAGTQGLSVLGAGRYEVLIEAEAGSAAYVLSADAPVRRVRP